MHDEVTIARRFNGPAESANGGYACGVVAAGVSGDTARVALRLPPPLDVPLRRVAEADGTVVLTRGDAVVATGEPAELTLEPPPAPSLAEARAATERFAARHDHPFPACFVCGIERPYDGLHVFPGPVEGGDGVIAAPWMPHNDIATGGVVDPEVVWAALDCPSGFACDWDGLAVLAGMTARLSGPVVAGRQHVVAGWPLSRDGRKHRSASAVYAEDGTVLAVAEALWIELRDPAAFGAPPG